MNFSKIVNTTKSITIKIGPIDEVISESKKDNEQIDPKLNYVLLAKLNVGNFQTTFDYTENKDLTKIKLNSSDKECLYIHAREKEDKNKHKKCNHYFVTNNDSIIKPECLITYKFEDVIKCQRCNLEKELKYCLNDDIYLCNECDDDIHIHGKNSTALKNHKRIPYCEYSVIHHNICKYHDKPYEIYCPECEELYCIKCQTTDYHSFIHDKNTKMIYINNQSSLLDEITVKQNTVILCIY